MESQIKIWIVVENLDINTSSGAQANMAMILNLRACGYALKVFHYSKKTILIDGVDCITIPERKLNVIYICSKIQQKLQKWTNGISIAI